MHFSNISNIFTSLKNPIRKKNSNEKKEKKNLGGTRIWTGDSPIFAFTAVGYSTTELYPLII